MTLQVNVKDNNIEQALRSLKKKMQREGVFRGREDAQSKSVHRQGEAPRHGRHRPRARGEERDDVRRFAHESTRRSHGFDEFHEDGVDSQVLQETFRHRHRVSTDGLDVFGKREDETSHGATATR